MVALEQKYPPIRMYFDTSVFGGVFDEEFARHSRKLFEQVQLGRIIPVVSELVAYEIKPAPPEVNTFFDEMSEHLERVESSKDALLLQEQYLKAEVITGKWMDDALHVAIATVEECSAIVSWNFKHLVNTYRIPLFNAVNRLAGYE